MQPVNSHSPIDRLPLTLGVAAYLARWREASVDADWREIAEEGGLTDDDTTALDRCCENLQAVGAPEAWLEDRGEEGAWIAEGVPEMLLAGLAVDESALPFLVEACRPPDTEAEALLTDALLRAGRRRLGQKEQITRLLAARGLQAAEHVPSDVKRELAEEMGSTFDSVSARLRDMRADARKGAERMSTAMNGAAPVAVETPQDDLSNEERFSPERVAEWVDAHGIDMRDPASPALYQQIGRDLGFSQHTAKRYFGMLRNERGIPGPTRWGTVPKPGYRHPAAQAASADRETLLDFGRRANEILLNCGKRAVQPQELQELVLELALVPLAGEEAR